MGARQTGVLLVAGALALSVLLFIAPKLKPKEEQPVAAAQTGSVNASEMDGTVDIYLNMATKNLPKEQAERYRKLSETAQHDSLAAFWLAQKRPDLAASFAEAAAAKKNTAEAWMLAGNRYYNSVQFTADKTEAPLLYESAMRCFNRAVQLDPANTEARIMLASCYVEGSSNPMQGIAQLREIEKTDSNNVKLQLSFAFFSVKSGQYNKAIERFRKALRADSNYIEAYLHLADAYEQMGDRENTIEMLRKYAARTGDVTARAEIDRYIEQLNKTQ